MKMSFENSAGVKDALAKIMQKAGGDLLGSATNEISGYIESLDSKQNHKSPNRVQVVKTIGEEKSAIIVYHKDAEAMVRKACKRAQTIYDAKIK